MSIVSTEYCICAGCSGITTLETVNWKCGHFFCRPCIISWCQISKRCPTCGTDMEDILDLSEMALLDIETLKNSANYATVIWGSRVVEKEPSLPPFAFTKGTTENLVQSIFFLSHHCIIRIAFFVQLTYIQTDHQPTQNHCHPLSYLWLLCNECSHCGLKFSDKNQFCLHMGIHDYFAGDENY